MRIATWNVNSIRTRVERVVEFLKRHDVDVLAMQEIKCRPDQFPTAPFEEAGYHLAIHGLNQWNGVAIASKYPLEAIKHEFSGQPAWSKEPKEPVVEARAIGATIQTPDRPFTIWSLYIPNGRELTDPHYTYKLQWLETLAENCQTWLAGDPEALISLVGDWNVAPEDHDVWDIDAFEGKTHVSEPERQALKGIEDTGFIEVTRPRVDNYTYWDYQQLRFPRNQGMRIDFVYTSPALAARVVDAQIDRDERRGKGASDHVPVIVDWE